MYPLTVNLHMHCRHNYDYPLLSDRGASLSLQDFPDSRRNEEVNFTHETRGEKVFTGSLHFLPWKQCDTCLQGSPCRYGPEEFISWVTHERLARAVKCQ